jgi:hypothetical protein
MNRVVVKSLWRDRTIYLVLIDADIVGLATLLRFARSEALKLLDRSSKVLFDDLFICDCVAKNYALAGKGSSS